jgi:hypothetical protein
MPLNRLRRILQNDCVVRLDSSDAIVQRVQERIATRQVTFQNKGKQHLHPNHQHLSQLLRIPLA